MNPVNTPPHTQHAPMKGYVYALFVVVIWTGFILVSRAGGVSVLSSWDVIAIRYLTAALIVLPLWCLRRPEAMFSARRALLAALGGLGYAMLAFGAFKLTPAVHAAVLLPGLQPFAAALAAWWLLGETPNRRRSVGLIVIAGGVACLALDGFTGTPGVFRGDLLMLGASACWACYSVLLRRWAVSPWDATLAVTLLTALVYLPIYAIALPKHLALASWSDIATQAVYQGVVATVIQMALYVRTVTLIGPTRLGMLMALVPGLAGVAAVPLLGEPLAPWVLCGLALVCLGAWLGSRQSIPTPETRPCPT